MMGIGNKCRREGLPEAGQTSLISSFKTRIEDTIAHADYQKPRSLKWNEGLAYSAGSFMENFIGCNVFPPSVINEGSEHDYIDLVFEDFSEHRRVLLVPERFKWSGVEEIAFDLMWSSFERQRGFTSGELLNWDYWTDIGVACNCHT